MIEMGDWVWVWVEEKRESKISNKGENRKKGKKKKRCFEMWNKSQPCLFFFTLLFFIKALSIFRICHMIDPGSGFGSNVKLVILYHHQQGWIVNNGVIDYTIVTSITSCIVSQRRLFISFMSLIRKHQRFRRYIK